MERSGRPMEKKKIRLLECIKYKIILLYTRRFKSIQIREWFFYEDFTEAMHEDPNRKPKIQHRGMKTILQQGQIPSLKTGGLLKQLKGFLTVEGIVVLLFIIVT